MGAKTSTIGAMLVLLTVAGCGNLGARHMPADQFDYNKAIARSIQEQMLLNVVRLRYFEAPVFLGVSSVLTQYAWQGTVGVTGQQGFNIGGGLESSSFIGGSALAQYLDRPTITYLPIEGDDFARRMMTPISVDLVLGLGEAGYPTDILLRAGINRINDVQNMAGGIPAPGDVDPALQAVRERENLARFQSLISLMMKLNFYNAYEVQRRDVNGEQQRVLVFSPVQSPEVAPLVDQFKTILGLDRTKNVFRIVDRRMGRGVDEITIQTRSLFQIMGFLALGVEVPPDQQQQTRMIGTGATAATGGDGQGVPFRVRWSTHRPADAFAAVEYNGYWYSMASTDIESKRGFNLMIHGFRLLAPERAAAAPVLSLPTGP